MLLEEVEVNERYLRIRMIGTPRLVVEQYLPPIWAMVFEHSTRKKKGKENQRIVRKLDVRNDVSAIRKQMKNE